jgi:hypothetical protein
MRSTLLVLLSALEVASALAARAFVRAPPPAMLLGADGLPMKKGAATAPSGGGEGQLEGGLAAFDREGDAAKVLGTFSMPDDLSDFDPTVDPLAVKRPEYDLAAASGRPDEAVWGAVATESAAELGEWAAHMKAAGVTRMLGLFTADDAAARSGAATAEAYFADLVAAGPFDAASVGLLDPRAEGAHTRTRRLGAYQRLAPPWWTRVSAGAAVAPRARAAVTPHPHPFPHPHPSLTFALTLSVTLTLTPTQLHVQARARRCCRC